MSSPVGVQWLYWTGIEGCKRGATITYHNHDLYRHTSRIPGAFIVVHVKKKQLLSISVWHLTTWDVQQTSQPNEMKFHHAAKMQCHLPMKATAGVFANFTLRETNTMHLWKRKFFSQYWKGLCFFRKGIEEPCLFSNYPSVYMRAKTILFVFQLLQNSG